MVFKCKHCGEQFTNEDIYRLHEANCLENQKKNGIKTALKKKGKEDNILNSGDTE